MARRAPFLSAWLVAACAAGAGACGDSQGDRPDAAGTPDAPPPPPDAGFAACRELAATPMPLPLHTSADVLDAGADLAAPQNCAVVDAPFGVGSAGVDRVIKLGGLTTGVEYGVSLDADADLGFYVITGCSTETGPSDAECALYVDASIGGGEHGRFAATGPTAWLVVDYYNASPPSDGVFTVDVYAIECDTSDTCDSATPACLDGRCVGCVSSFDCTTPEEPACDTLLHACGGGDATCAGDDAAEPFDDGPHGGRAIAVDAGGNATLTGSICNTPVEEVDFFWFQVTSPGETWSFDLAWTGASDLDLYVYDAVGRDLGLSFYEQPEPITLTYLAPGIYYVMVDNYQAAGATDAYTLDVQRTLGPGCASAIDCAAEYRNQVFRGACVEGACVPIAGGGAVAEGGACDSTSDCAEDLYCPSFFFVADAATRDTCARGCMYDTDCAPLGADYVCTTYLSENFCVQKCSVDEQCPTSVGSEPITPPWYRLECQPSTGRCLPP
jgi:hypothetical protein